MAEFLGQKKPEKLDMGPGSGFDAMGKPVPTDRKMAADRHLMEMGVTDSEDRFTCIQRVSIKLERDDPYGAMQEGMKFVDLTGIYRLMAALLTDPEPVKKTRKRATKKSR